MTAQLRARLESRPARVVLTGTEISGDSWNEIALVVGGDSNLARTEIRVSADGFLRSRQRLSGTLRSRNVAFEVDDNVRALLVKDGRDISFLNTVDATDTARGIDLSDELARGLYRVIRTLREFQVRDLNKLMHLHHGANFSVPGAGKTTVAYALHAIEQARGRVDKLLVIAPLSAFGAWEEDAVSVLSPAPSVARVRSKGIPNADVILINYQRVPGAIDDLISWASRHHVHLVLDEAHRAKRGISGEWGRALLALAPHVVRRDVLTGTPAPNHPRDLKFLLDFLWPSGRASRRIPDWAMAPQPAPRAMRVINEAITPLFVRTTKTELDIPDSDIRRVQLPMNPLQQEIYDALLNRYAGLLDLSRGDQLMFAQMGEITMYLLQAASSPRLLRSSADAARAYRFPPLAIPAGSHLAEMVERYADHEISAKIEAVCRLVSENSRRPTWNKTLVWSNFPGNLLDLEQQLAALEPAIVYGGVPSSDDAPEGVRTREREIERFRRDPNCKVLLANPAALAEGVSLHMECHDAIYLDRTFNAGQYLQSLDRIHRLGLPQDTQTTFTIFSTIGSIDERVDRRVEEKVQRLSQLLADDRLVELALPDDEEPAAVLDDRADLEAVLAELGRRRN
ncbi:SNF2-related protein [Subtercola lobariae]|uniref:DNA helicase n=1 Tax=Subtercola lobariae TaxID=1588641 RepID=A0A917B342_9MICO|nr:DEAD/DEAH box helicase [Subtercola lobariae]GGF18122.1 DNA helicase [Subtercola lobariae]